ncbi:MAG: hypothetical protein IJS54_01190 [Desulfovibrio sp.]|nr:hypothetical protein [Desulfovibrio sp.]
MQAMEAVIAWLSDRHDHILGKEKAALVALENGDLDTYRTLLREKAESVASMAKDAKDVLAALPDEQKGQIFRKLVAFSNSAAFGLKVQSVFYWRVLLYRDDHEVGDPDTLQEFINQLREGALGE